MVPVRDRRPGARALHRVPSRASARERRRECADPADDRRRVVELADPRAEGWIAAGDRRRDGSAARLTIPHDLTALAAAPLD